MRDLAESVNRQVLPASFAQFLAVRSREAGLALTHAGMGDRHAGRGGFPHQSNLRRGQAVGLVCVVAVGALQVQGFGGEGAGGRAEKLKLGKQSTLRPPPEARFVRRAGSLATEHGKAEIARRRVRRSAAVFCLPIFLALAPLLLKAPGFRFPPSGFSFQRFSVSAF
jgi:hypothetical protein